MSHADPIKAAIAHYTGVHLDLFQRIVVSPASVTAFEFSAHGVAMLKCNDTGDARRAAAPDRPEPNQDTEKQPERATLTQCLIRSSSTPSTRSAPAPSASPASAPSTSRPRTDAAQLTVLVEKEQVALLATEAVAFLDRIADDYPEDPIDAAADRSPSCASPRCRSSAPG